MPKQCKEKAMHPSTWKVNSAKLNFALTEFSEVRATLRRLFLLRTDHQHWAVGMPDNRIRDAAHQHASQSAESTTAHHYQVRSELLSQGHDLQVHRPHPEVSPRHGATGGLHPPGLFPEQFPGLLFYLLVELAVVAERPWIAIQENGHHSDMPHVQLGVGCIGQVTALRAASSASSEPSVASRILVGKLLIAILSFPIGTSSRDLY